jgi:bifunctional UDP-N-acetylglucosamine pyrophosphorylase/glucosamine-1-phosphate N-acetyltransferase
MEKISAIILAAGKGERMNSDIPKVLHTICGKPLLEYSFDLARSLKIKSVLVLKEKNNLFDKLLPKDAKIAYQHSPLGTADAIKQVKKFAGLLAENVVILYGDSPLLRKETLKNLVFAHIKSKADATILSAHLENPAGYGRVVRDNLSNIIKIVEDRDAVLTERNIKEINTGIIVFKKKSLVSLLGYVKQNISKKEFYLTDIISVFREKGLKIDSFVLEDFTEALGINTQADLILAREIMRKRILQKLSAKGVEIVNPDTVFIDADVDIGKDTIIYPFVVVARDVKIGKNCSIGPFCHLRENTIIEDNNTIGNFSEIVRTKIGSDSFVKHFSYLGDTIVGKRVNVGAGVVTANFDKGKKLFTKIKDNAFLGCDTIIVAPVTIGKNAVTGAGSVVIKNTNVPDGSLVLGVPAKIKHKSK